MKATGTVATFFPVQPMTEWKCLRMPDLEQRDISGRSNPDIISEFCECMHAYNTHTHSIMEGRWAQRLEKLFQF